jgi:Ca-activated chloride channel family protein
MNTVQTVLSFFGRPIFLTLLALLPVIWWRWRRPARHAALRFSTVANLRRPAPTWRIRARVLLPILRMLTVALLVVCLARPQKGDEETRVVSEGVAIQLLVDRSASMLAQDFTIGDQRVDRLAAIKHVAEKFVTGDRGLDLAGRPDDLIGLITFARYADSLCPLTLDHGYLLDTLKRSQIVAENDADENGTAIGDALALGVLRMQDIEKKRPEGEEAKIKSKVLVLLTDGEQNMGDLSPLQGAELAKAEGIKIYTIGVGTQGQALMPQNVFGMTRLVPVRVTIDEETLKQVAAATGGEYFRATDTESLQKIYQRIDALEKTKTEEKRYLQQAELAIRSVKLGGVTWPPLLLVTLGLLALETVLAHTQLRKIP